MFIHKKRYFFIIENIKNINLENIKKLNKFNIIYRTNKLKDKKTDLLKFRNICKRKRINFYVANNLQLSKTIKADGLYISALNSSLKYKYFKNFNFEIIGSAHNHAELKIKKLQGCSIIFLSRLFETNYKNKKSFLGLVKFNLFSLKTNLAPLGGINKKNLNYLKNIKCDSFALSSAFIKDNKINKIFY